MVSSGNRSDVPDHREGRERFCNRLIVCRTGFKVENLLPPSLVRGATSGIGLTLRARGGSIGVAEDTTGKELLLKR